MRKSRRLQRVRTSGNTVLRPILGLTLVGFLILLPTFAAAQATITVAMGVQSFEGLDPHMQASPPTNAIVKAIFDNLVFADERNEIHPMLATSWQMVDDLTWDFTIRQGVLFHDGAALNADAVVATFERVLDPDAGLTRRSSFDMVESVEALGDYLVRFHLRHPSAIFLNQLAYASGGIISPAAIEAYGKDIAVHPIGAGPYKLKEYVGGERIILEAFTDYWGGTPALSEIVYVPVTEDATRVLMLQTGQADVVANVPASMIPMVEQATSAEVLTADTTRVIHIGMNVSKSPFDSELVRHALNYAVDKEAIVRSVLNSLGTVTNSYIAPTTWGYFDNGGYPYDPERAQELLAEAGFPNGFTTSLWVPAGRYFGGQQVAEAVQGYLRDVGIDVRLESVEWGAFVDRILTPLDAGNVTEMYLLGWEASTGEPSIVSLWALGGTMMPPNGWNAMFYENPTFDDLIERGGQTSDAVERAAIFKEAQEIVVADAPWIFLYASKSVWGVNGHLKGVMVLSDETLILNNAYLED